MLRQDDKRITPKDIGEAVTNAGDYSSRGTVFISARGQNGNLLGMESGAGVIEIPVKHGNPQDELDAYLRDAKMYLTNAINEAGCLRGELFVRV